MYENKAYIENQVADVIKELFPHTKDLLNENVYDSPLTGQPLYFNGILLVYLFFELEKRLHLRFSEEDLINYRFYTIEQIAKRICEKKQG